MIMKRIFFVVISCCASALFAAQDLITDDGREVRLGDNGSWIYLSTDRFATAADGQRVRLKEDGSWEYADSDKVSYSSENSQSKTQNNEATAIVEKQSLELKLSELFIESYKAKKSEAHKNSRKKTRSVFIVNLQLAANADQPVSLAANNEDFSVIDSDGREYPVLTVSSNSLVIKPGEEVELVVTADGSPHWWTTKAMSLIINKRLMQSEKDLVLEQSMSRAKKRKFEGG